MITSFRQRKLWFWGVIALAAIVILTIFTAPNSNQLVVGSTYSKEPNGYGAWYEYMSNKGVAIERWQKPFSEIAKKNELKNVTYLQIYPQTRSFFNSASDRQNKWIREGNKLVILGVRENVTPAPFTSIQSYKNLQFKIKTTRRAKKDKNAIVRDKYGTIVWREKVKQGEIIYAVSPYIAANAYQGVADNYEFLAQLVDTNNRIFVDEYIHGYKDMETKAIEKQGTLTDYLIKTIWLPLSIQGLLISMILIAFSWQRFGQPKTVVFNKKVDNSQAYIEALAGVLEKAGSTDFAMQTIHQDEQLKLQKKLGLGRKILPAETLLDEWVKQTQKPKDELAQLLRVAENKKRISEPALVKWIQKWQQINR